MSSLSSLALIQSPLLCPCLFSPIQASEIVSQTEQPLTNGPAKNRQIGSPPTRTPNTGGRDRHLLPPAALSECAPPLAPLLFDAPPPPKPILFTVPLPYTNPLSSPTFCLRLQNLAQPTVPFTHFFPPSTPSLRRENPE